VFKNFTFNLNSIEISRIYVERKMVCFSFRFLLPCIMECRVKREKPTRCNLSDNQFIVNVQYISVDTTILYMYLLIVILATCFDSYESSSGINIQELPVHIVLQFFVLVELLQ
jgi:hypothetical protein